MAGFLVDYGMDVKITYNTQKAVMKHIHVHPQYELYFCPQGVEQNSVINGVEYVCEHPCAILSAPFTVHSMSSDDPRSESYERYVFYFGENMLESLGPRLLPLRAVQKNAGLLFKLTEPKAQLIKSVIDACAPDRSKTPCIQVELTFALVINKLFDMCAGEDIVRIGDSSFYIQDVLQYISENFREQNDVEAIAVHFAVSRSKLDRDFKHFTGLTVHKFIELCKFNQAKYMLLDAEGYSVEQISDACGFSTQTHFFPFFKKHTGMTPLEYRNSATKKLRKEI